MNKHTSYSNEGITYHHSYEHLTNIQLKQIFVGTLKWALEGGYVGENAGVFMNEFEAFDGDVCFTAEQIEGFMKCPIVRSYAKLVVLEGRPIHWPQVVTMLEEPYQQHYKSKRGQMQEDSDECDADKAVENLKPRHWSNEDLKKAGY